MRDNLDAVRETTVSFIARHGVVGWLLVMITAVLCVSIATSLYLAWRLDQNSDKLVENAVATAKAEAIVKDELLRIQRENLQLRVEGQSMMDRHVRALDALTNATQWQGRLLEVLINRTEQGTVETRRAAEGLTGLRSIITGDPPPPAEQTDGD